MLDYQSSAVSLEDIIFENRNKAYGAYELRTRYQERAIKSSFWAVFILLLSLVGPIVAKQISDRITPPSIAEDFNNGDITLIPPPPLDSKTLPPPVAKVTPPPTEANTIRYTKPEVAIDDEVTEVIAKNSELEKAVISNVTAQGTEDGFDIPETPGTSTQVGTGTLIETVVEQEAVTVVEEMPEFPGGVDKMLQFLSKNMKYPKQAISAEKQGRVYVQFIVGTNGELSSFEVVRGVGFGLDEEALKAAMLMPNWKPGRQGGKAVKVKCVVPVEFKLE
jgi:periplasmic protein TonB